MLIGDVPCTAILHSSLTHSCYGECTHGVQVLPATECMHVACFITINHAVRSGGPRVDRYTVLASTLCVHTGSMPCHGRQVTKGAHYVLMLFWSASGGVFAAGVQVTIQCACYGRLPLYRGAQLATTAEEPKGTHNYIANSFP